MKGWRALQRVALALGAFVGLCVPCSSVAHPHAWIDLRTSVVIGNGGRIMAIEQEWLLDPLYSTLLIDGLGTNTTALRAHGADMLARLSQYNYFTEIKVDGKARTPATVTEFSTELRSNRFWIRFVLPISAPVDPLRQTLSYAVYDPTYYIEILHLEEDVIEFLGAEPGRCAAWIKPPEPTPEAIMRARSIAIDTSPDKSLGALFAERVRVACK